MTDADQNDLDRPCGHWAEHEGLRPQDLGVILISACFIEVQTTVPSSRPRDRLEKSSQKAMQSGILGGLWTPLKEQQLPVSTEAPLQRLSTMFYICAPGVAIHAPWVQARFEQD